MEKRLLRDGDRIQFGRTTILKFSLSDEQYGQLAATPSGLIGRAVSVVWQAGQKDISYAAKIERVAMALLPIYASEILEVGARGYGLLSASLELGALLTAAAMI